MSCKLAACLAAGLCLARQVTHAQNVDSAIDKATDFPSKLFSRITGQTANMNQQLTRQTEKYLQKMARKEAKLRAQLYKTDSAKAAALYPNDPQQQYAALMAKFKQDSAQVFSSMGPEYLPHVDSLNGMLGFLSKNPSLLKGGIPEQAQVQAALAQFQQLQAKLQAGGCHQTIHPGPQGADPAIPFSIYLPAIRRRQHATRLQQGSLLLCGAGPGVPADAE